MKRVAVAAALGAGLALAGTARAALARVAPTPAPAPADARRALARADSLELRLVQIERRLGIGVAGYPGRADADFRARYAALRAREAEAARRAEEWLRYLPSSAPVDGGIVTSTFSPGRYHPIRHRVLPHVGLDIGASYGAPVRATADGSVFATANNPTYGLTVDVRHGDSGFMTRYAHLSRIGVRRGQVVRRGEVVGWVGSTGLSTGPHTHYEVFFRGWRRDPVDFLPPGRVAERALLGADW